MRSGTVWPRPTLGRHSSCLTVERYKPDSFLSASEMRLDASREIMPPQPRMMRLLVVLHSPLAVFRSSLPKECSHAARRSAHPIRFAARYLAPQG